MATSGVTIRRLEMSDLAIFKQIRLEALRAEPANFSSTYEDWAALSDEAWRQRLSDAVFVAFQGDGAVGGEEAVGMMGLARESGRKSHRAMLRMVYLRKELRGTGLARDLLATIVAYAGEIGVWQLELAVSAENAAAQRFYAREGFREMGRIPAGFLHEGQEIDDIQMVRRLA